MTKRSSLPIEIVRDVPPIPAWPFSEYFRGFDKVQAVRQIFGDETDEVLGRLKVRFVSNKYMFMGVSDRDGNLNVGTYHLRNSELRILYLDIVHELFHVRQFMRDKKYFHKEHMRYLKKTGFDTSLYYRSPIEIPAYRHAVNEAKRIGMSYDEIADYLRMGFVEDNVFSRLLKDVGLQPTMTPGPRASLPVRINRMVRIPLYPFTDYFKGFHRVGTVRDLFDGVAEEFLAGLKVEFSGLPMKMISPDEEDGHLQVSAPYMKTGDERLLYLDVLVCLSLLRGSAKGGTPAGLEDGRLTNSELFVDSYRATVREGRRLGLSDDELADHITMPRFLMGPDEFAEFLQRVGLRGKGD